MSYRNQRGSYRLNVNVDKRNNVMLNLLASKDRQCSIKSCDSIGGQTHHVDLRNLSDKRGETGGLHGTLVIAVGARVMLTANVDVSDGLANGARGVIVHVVTKPDGNVTKILVRFDNPSVGQVAIQSSVYRGTYGNAIPISKYEATFLAKGKRGSEVIRLQFPLTLAWATTIHKVQGLTLEEKVVDMGEGNRFNPGQAYVGFSRVKNLQGLHILNFNLSSIKKSKHVCDEMFRLNTNLLSVVPVLQCHQLTSSHVTFVLLNVRCLCAKLSDLKCDANIQCASVVFV